MKFIDSVKKEQYEEFVANHPTKSHFMQSYAWGEVCKTKGLIPHYVGIEENGTLIGASLLLQKKLFLGYSHFYAPRGYVIDYTNLDALKYFTNEIKKYINKYKGIFLKIDPDIKLHNLDENGNIIDDNFNNYKLIDYLKSIGYKHKGFNKNFEGNQPRYTFRLDLKPSIDEIRSRMHPTTRKIINKANPYDLKIVIGDATKIKEFTKLMNVTSKRDGFVSSSYKYYYNFYHILNNYKMSDLYYIEVSIKDIINKTEKMINESKSILQTLKNDGKKKDLLLKIKKLEENLVEYRNYQYDDNILISSIITVKYGNKVWTIHGGNHNIFRDLDANYLLYYNILLKAKEEGYEIIDFFGTTGNPTSDNKIYGIHLFKKRFGGEYLEFIGEFDLVSDKFMYMIFAKIIPIYHSIIRRINKYRNRRLTE